MNKVTSVPTEFEDNAEQLPPETEQVSQEQSGDSAGRNEESNRTGWPCSIYNLSFLLVSSMNCILFCKFLISLKNEL